MPGERELTHAQDVLADVLADAIVADLLEAGGLWIAVSCHGVVDQTALTDRLRAEGREVRVRHDAA